MRGLLHALQVESAFRQELIAAAVLVPTVLALALPAMETVALLNCLMTWVLIAGPALSLQFARMMD